MRKVSRASVFCGQHLESMRLLILRAMIVSRASDVSQGYHRASIDLERAYKGSRPERSSQSTNQGERTTDGQVEDPDDVNHLVEMLRSREVAEILMREGSSLVELKAYLFLKWISIPLVASTQLSFRLVRL